MVERDKIDTRAHKYMTTHFPVLLQALHEKSVCVGMGGGGVN